MSDFGGSWKHQNNPACTESVSLHTVEVGRVQKKTLKPSPYLRISATNAVPSKLSFAHGLDQPETFIFYSLPSQVLSMLRQSEVEQEVL